MVGGISGLSPYTGIYQYMGYTRVGALSRPSQAASVQAGQASGAVPAERMQASGAGLAERVQSGQRVTTVMAAGRTANPGAPVEPVGQVPVIGTQAARSSGYVIPFLRQGMDPAELAVRMRIQYADGTQGTKEEGECRTCQERKYQDGSDDSGVSYQTPTHIAPEQAASAVRGHEMEHVVRERAAAVREDRRVVSQSVTMHTAICPECGRVYVSGGTTRTVTASDSQMEQSEPDMEKG